MPVRPFHARDWLEQRLERAWGLESAPPPSKRVRAWGVGTVSGNETLVQSRPTVRDGNLDFLSDFLRAAGRCTLSVYETGLGEKSGIAVKMARFGRWVGAFATEASILDEDIRDREMAALPDFIKRGMVGATEGELILGAFLARLHGRSSLGGAYSADREIRGALSQLHRDLGSPPMNLMVFDGKSFGMLHADHAVGIEDVPEKDQRESGPILVASRPNVAKLLTLRGEQEPDPAVELVPRGVFTVNARDPATLIRDDIAADESDR